MITATFPAGVLSIVANGLHQWDYGQKLKIKATDLPSLIEVHFACAGMDKAVVRSCSVTVKSDGIGEGTVTIPDDCLEQTSPVYAWICEVGSTSSTTLRTIRLNITARTRPDPYGTVPAEISNRYTELVNAINTQIAALKTGSVKVSAASTADNATNANYAARAGTASSAASATRAETAAKADNATRADIADTATNADNATQADNAATAVVAGSTRTLHTNDDQVDGAFEAVARDDEHGYYYCDFRPTLDREQNLGDEAHKFGNIFSANATLENATVENATVGDVRAAKLRATALCKPDGAKIMEVAAFSKSGYSAWAKDLTSLLIARGVYTVQVGDAGVITPDIRGSATSFILDLAGDYVGQVSSPIFRINSTDYVVYADQQTAESGNKFLLSIWRADGSVVGESTGLYLRYRPILLY